MRQFFMVDSGNFHKKCQLGFPHRFLAAPLDKLVKAVLVVGKLHSLGTPALVCRNVKHGQTSHKGVFCHIDAYTLAEILVHLHL